MNELGLIVSSLIQSIKEFEKVILALSDKNYSFKDKQASVGQHTRHCIEHIQEFIKGLSSGVINYDKRQRNSLLETSPQAALSEFRVLIQALKALSLNKLYEALDLEFILNVKEDYKNLKIKTTFQREILFLDQHMTHHLAMLELLLKQRGFDLSIKHKAPSTTLFEETSF